MRQRSARAKTASFTEALDYPATALFVSGMLSLAAALILGIRTALDASNAIRMGPHLLAANNLVWRGQLQVALALMITAIVLFLSLFRYGSWQEVKRLKGNVDEERETAQCAITGTDIGVCLLLIAVAAYPRLIALNHSLWYDEIWTVTAFMHYGPAYAVTHYAFNNHLLNSLLGSLCIGWYATPPGGGAPPFIPPAWVVRLPSLVFGLFAPPLLYLAIKRHIDRPAAFAAAALLAFSPAAVDFSTQARGYSAALFFAVAQAYCLDKAVRTAAASAWVGWMLCCVLGIFAHLFFVSIIAADLVYVLILVLWLGLRGAGATRCYSLLEQTLAMLICWIALTYVCYSGAIQGMERAGLSLSKTEPNPMARAHDLLLPTLQSWAGVPTGPWLTLFYALAAVLCLLGIVRLALDNSGAALYLPLVIVAGPLITEWAQPHFLYPRFYVPVLPAFLALAAAGASLPAWLLSHKEPDRPKRRNEKPRDMAPVGAAVTLALCTLFWLPMRLGLADVMNLPKQNFQAAADYLRTQQKNKTQLLGIGAGNEFLDFFDVKLKSLSDEADLRASLGKKPALVLDTGVMVNPNRPQPALRTLIHTYAGPPLIVFPGRYRNWESRWLDGGADLAIYRLRPDKLPKLKPVHKPKASRHGRKGKTHGR